MNQPTLATLTLLCSQRTLCSSLCLKLRCDLKVSARYPLSTPRMTILSRAQVPADWYCRLKGETVNCRSTILTIAIACLLTSQSQANCSQAGQEAKSMCSSETLTSMADAKQQSILKNFNPANGRMSPESCQGFSDAYRDFKRLVNDYVTGCQSKIQQAASNCRPTNSVDDIDDFLAGAELVKSARASFPKLLAYRPAFEKLDQRLADCLRQTPGHIVNTDTDRGNANTQAQIPPSPSTTSSVAGGAVINPQIHGDPAAAPATPRRIIPAYCSDPALSESSMCQQGTESAPEPEKEELSKSRHSLAQVNNSIQGKALHDTPARTPTQPALVSHHPTRTPASIDTLIRHPRIHGRHSDLFRIIHIRYLAQDENQIHLHGRDK